MSLFNRRNNPIGSMFTGGGMTPGQTIGRAYADFGKTIGTQHLTQLTGFKGEPTKEKRSLCHNKPEKR